MEWISVNDRLPEILDRGPKHNACSEDVLAYDGKEQFVAVRWICGEQFFFCGQSMFPHDEITHWMSLPNSPDKI